MNHVGKRRCYVYCLHVFRTLWFIALYGYLLHAAFSCLGWFVDLSLSAKKLYMVIHANVGYLLPDSLTRKIFVLTSNILIQL